MKSTQKTTPRGKKPALASTPAPESKPVVVVGEPDKRKKNLAYLAADPIVRNAQAANCFVEGFGDIDFAESISLLVQRAADIHNGDLRETETMLVAQANTLDAIFTVLARRSARNMGHYMDASDTYMRLALRAQNQCRATLETLAAIKNPAVVISKQTNIAHGHQQVNNGDALPATNSKLPIEPTELMENDHGQRLDTGTTGAAGQVDLVMATVGEIDGTEDGRR